MAHTDDHSDGNETKLERKYRLKDKHSLDGDEEDNEQISGKMANDDNKGQEDNTVDFDDGIKVTLFN